MDPIDVELLLTSTLTATKAVFPMANVERAPIEKDGERDYVAHLDVLSPAPIRLHVHGSRQAFSLASECLFGMRLEGDMLSSFVGELTNMIAGSTVTEAMSFGLSLQITPPEVRMEEPYSPSHFVQSIQVAIAESEKFHVTLHPMLAS